MPGPAGLYTKPPVALLTLEHAGRVWRVASKTCDVQDADGRWHHYKSGIGDYDIHREAVPFSFEIAGQIDVEAVVPESFSDLQALGEDPAAITGEISLWREGDPWESRERFQSGPVTVQSWGSATEPARLSLLPADPSQDKRTYPPESQVISEETWYTSGGLRSYDEDTAGGRPYPQPFGRVGRMLKRAGIATMPGSPAYPVVAAGDVLEHRTPFHDASGKQIVITDIPGNPSPPVFPAPGWFRNYVLIAGGWVWPQLQPATLDYRVTLHGSDGSSEWAYLYFARDALGQICALAGKIGFTSPSGLYGGSGIVPGNEYWVSFDDGSLANRWWSGAVRDAGELLQWVFELCQRPMDWRRTSAALTALRQFRLAGYWDQSCDPWAWAADNLQDLLPISMLSGADGVYPMIWRVHATASDAIVHLVDGLDCTVEDGPLQEGEDRVVASAAITFATALSTGADLGRKALGTDPDPDDVQASASLHSRRAGLAWPDRDETLSTDVICDDAQTADLVLAWRAQVFGRPWTVLHVVGDGLHHRRLGHLEPGDVVTITSERCGFDRRVAHVRRAGWAGAIAYVDLFIFQEP